MRKLILVFLAIVMVASFSNKAVAQTEDTKSNDANAQILGAIALTVGDPLEFGGIIPDGSASGTVEITTAGVRNLTTVTGVTASTTPSAASYSVTGTGLVPYTITIPTTSFNITNTTGSGAETMAVTAMTCSGTLNHIFASDGTDAFTVGGTLTVGAAQVPGLYTGTFDVTVEY
jgi:hypothetical protein